MTLLSPDTPALRRDISKRMYSPRDRKPRCRPHGFDTDQRLCPHFLPESDQFLPAERPADVTTAAQIARTHFDAALAEAQAADLGSDSTVRCILGLVVAKYLETRPVADVSSELAFVAENCDPDTDYVFMRP